MVEYLSKKTKKEITSCGGIWKRSRPAHGIDFVFFYPEFWQRARQITASLRLVQTRVLSSANPLQKASDFQVKTDGALHSFSQRRLDSKKCRTCTSSTLEPKIGAAMPLLPPSASTLVQPSGWALFVRSSRKIRSRGRGANDGRKPFQSQLGQSHPLPKVAPRGLALGMGGGAM